MGYIKENTMQNFIMPKYEARKPSQKELKNLPMESLRKTNKCLGKDHPLAIPFHFGIHTGLRVSEVFGLMWKNIDLDRGTLSVGQA